MAFGFGPLPSAPAGFGMEDLARLFGRVPMGAGQGFSGSSTGPTPDASVFQPPAAQQAVDVPLPPQRPLSFGPMPKAQAVAPAEADLPMQDAQPIMGRAPAFGGNPTSQAAPAQSDEPGWLSRNSDLLIGLGTGLLSTPGLGAGMAAGLQNAQKARALGSANDLARAELGLKQQKLAREQRGENATAQAIAQRLGIPMDQALGFAGNPAFVGEFLKGNFGTPEGYTRTSDGLVPVPGGPQDVATLRARAQAQAEGTAAGTGDQWNLTDAPDGSKIAVNKNDPADVRIVQVGQAPRPATDEERRQYGIQPGTAVKMSAKDGPVAVGGGNTVINNAVNPVLKGLGEQFTEGAATARASADAVRAVQNARSQLDAPGGIYAGSFAENRLALQKLGSFLGVADPAAIQNTETFRTQIKPIVLETVKGLGAGSGISNADRDFALQAVGGDIKLDEGTIRRVLDVTERSARAKIDRHNVLADKMLEAQPDYRAVAPMLRIDQPEASKPAATAPQTSVTQPSEPLDAARAAIARGAPRAAVMQRLLQSGIDPKGL